MRVILKLDEANKTVLWFRKLNLNYLWDLIQKLNPIYILDLILANGQPSAVKVRGWLNLLGIVLASKNEHVLIF